MIKHPSLDTPDGARVYAADSGWFISHPGVRSYIRGPMMGDAIDGVIDTQWQVLCHLVWQSRTEASHQYIHRVVFRTARKLTTEGDAEALWRAVTENTEHTEQWCADIRRRCDALEAEHFKEPRT
ncbi:MAG: hypothetical protein ACLQJR_18395 [Stellaceae bacterium]